MKPFDLFLFLFLLISPLFAQELRQPSSTCSLVGLEKLTTLLELKQWDEAQKLIVLEQAKISNTCWEFRFLKTLSQLTASQIPKQKLSVEALALDLEYGESSFAKDHVLLMTAATLYGVVLGAYSFGIMADTTEQVGVPLSIALGGVGLYSSYLWMKAEPRKTNMGIALSSGLVIAPIYTSLLLNSQLAQMGEKEIATVLMTASTLGGGLMSYWASQKKVSSGDIYLFDSLVIWSNLMTVYLRDVLDISSDNIINAHTIGTTVGLLTGFSSAYLLDWSAKKVGLINLGGLAGGLVAFGLSTLFNVNSELQSSMLTLGAMAGLGSGIYLTREID